MEGKDKLPKLGFELSFSKEVFFEILSEYTEEHGTREGFKYISDLTTKILSYLANEDRESMKTDRLVLFKWFLALRKAENIILMRLIEPILKELEGEEYEGT